MGTKEPRTPSRVAPPGLPDPRPISSRHLNSLTARIQRYGTTQRNGEEILREETGRAEEDGSRFIHLCSRRERERGRKRDPLRRNRSNKRLSPPPSPLSPPSHFFVVASYYTHCHSQQLNQGSAKNGRKRTTYEDHARRILHMDHRMIARRPRQGSAGHGRGGREGTQKSLKMRRICAASNAG